MDQFRAEWRNLKTHFERQMTLLEPPASMRTTDKNGKDTTEQSKERIRRIIRELDRLLQAHEPSP
jgi:hypothetical protein